MGGKRDSRTIFHETIINAFANADTYNVQSPDIFWAIEEGCGRTGLIFRYQVTNATKNHKCVRGCKINMGDKYFKPIEAFANTKICGSCMAMVLFFKEVWDLPSYRYDRWDEESGHPHLDANGTMTKDLKSALDHNKWP